MRKPYFTKLNDKTYRNTDMPSRQPVGTAKTTSSRALPKPGPEKGQAEEEQEQQPSGGRSRADLFRSAPKAEGFNFPVGQYTAILVECTALREGEKESLCFKYEVNDGGEQDGKSVCAFYNFFDENGVQQRGMEFFKKDIETLEEDVNAFIEAYADSTDAFDDRLRVLAEERKECVIEVKKSKGYTNTYLQGLAQQ